MLSTTSLLASLKTNYPQFSFKPGDDYLWSSSDNTIYYDKNTNNRSEFLLHELSHALLEHTDYTRDIQLITMERQAWDYAIKLAPTYNITIPSQIVESTMDSYRDWLHGRSTCPKCKATGIQTDKHVYRCLTCDHSWRVNEARTCALRRYNLKNNKKRTD